MAAKLLNQLKLLLWKNFKLITSHFYMLALCVVVALVVLIMMLSDRINFKFVHYDPIKDFKPDIITELMPIKNDSGVEIGISYCPENEFLGNIVKLAAAKLNLSVLTLPTERILVRHLLKNKTIAGIVFEDNWRNIDTYPSNLSYKLRLTSKIIKGDFWYDQINWRTEESKSLLKYLGSKVLHNNKDLEPYFSYNFVQIQHALFLAFMEVTRRRDVQTNDTIPDIIMKRFPLPSHSADYIWRSGLSRYIVTIIFACPSAYLSQFIAVEKKKQFKIVTATMGVPNWLHWLSWYMSGTIFFLFFMAALLIFYKTTSQGESIISSTSTLLLIVFLFVNVMTYVAFSFMFGIFFSDSRKLYIAAFLFHAVLAPTSTSFMLNKYVYMESWQILFLCLLTNFAASFAMAELAFFEIQLNNLNFHTMFSIRESHHKSFCFGYAFIMLLVDFIIYILITLYVEQLCLRYPPKWHFPLSNFIRKSKKYKGVSEELDYEYFAPEEKHVGIHMKNLNVEINRKPIIRELSMSVYEGELTVIYGHAGAGKSVLAAVLTGAFPFTTGTLTIDNATIRGLRYANLARLRIGYCPSHDVLLNELTVEEHIWLCSRLKGSEEVQTEQELRKYTSALGLERNLQTKCGTLLLTEKNMVILCTTLCGGSKVIICDEPTMGLDPTSKEVIWNLLRMERMNKTILIFSKSISKEINTFADRAGILIKGELRGYGELNYFGNNLGRGYELLCIKENNCNSDNVTDFVRKFIPNIEIEEEKSNEIVYFLSEITMPKLGELIAELDQQKLTLGLEKFSLRLRLIEEIMYSSAREYGVKPIRFPELELLHDFKLTQRRWRAMFFKKLVFTVARFWILAGVILLFCILYALITYNLWQIVLEEPPVLLFDTLSPEIVVLQAKPVAKIERYIFEQYIYQVKTSKHIEMDEDFGEYILQNVGNSLQLYIMYWAGVTISKEQIIAWYNGAITHAAPLSLNLVHNAILKAFCGTSHFISLQNAPLHPHYTNQLVTSRGGETFGQFFTLTLAVITPLCIIQIMVERATGYKTFQLNTGLTPAIYWASSMIWDYIMVMIIALILMLTVCMFTIKSPFTLHMIGVMCIVYMVFGFAAITSSYLFASFFMKASDAYVILCALNIITGFFLYTIFHFYLSEKSGDVYQWLLYIFPHYACAMALVEAFEVAHTLTLCNSICEELGICEDNLCSKIPSCCKEQHSYFTLDHEILSAITYMLVVGIVCLVLFILYEIYGVRFYCPCLRKRFPVIESPPMDKHASMEALRVSVMTRDQKMGHPLLLENVSLFFGRRPALNHITFSVSKGEVFGIVGPPGAGKKTIIKLLTSNLKPSLGDIFLNGKPIEEAFKDDISCIGYCPEGGGLDGYLTGRDALHICCLLRGIRDQDLEYTYGKVVKFLGIKKLLDTEVRYYNESDKKKLNFAMSVLGNVNIIIVNQGTYGCEPIAIRKICDLIEILQSYGKTVIFTTKSVIEGIFLCNRVLVLVNGEMLSVGNPNELDASLKSGVNLMIKFNDFTHNDMQSQTLFQENFIKAKRFIEGKYPDIILRSEYHGILQYIMHDVKIEEWPSLINILEYFKAKYNIGSYELTRIGIVSTFTTIARKQRMVHKRK